jgi:hydroxymethylpyrimidine pyrophosphatase-like HAD family hydrolase
MKTNELFEKCLAEVKPETKAMVERIMDEIILGEELSKENRQQLIKELSKRTAHHVVITCHKTQKYTTNERTNIAEMLDGLVWLPYLRPISSLTEEEMDKMFEILRIDKDGKDEDWIKINECTGIKLFLTTGRYLEDIEELLDYLRSIHIDFNGLIDMGLAIEVTKENNPYPYLKIS